MSTASNTHRMPGRQAGPLRVLHYSASENSSSEAIESTDVERQIHGSPAIAEADLVLLRSSLSRAVAQVCPPWLAASAEDVVQVALLRVVEVHRRGDGSAPFSAGYLRKAAYSAVIDEIRRLKRRREVPLDEPDVETRHASVDPDPEQSSAARQLGRAIRDCLARLVRPRRLAVTLHLVGHSVPEAARLLGWSPKRAENLVYRGLADLRRCLELAGVGR
jgi:RNA polymerase sigma-70 factor (ECF subfamily)